MGHYCIIGAGAAGLSATYMLTQAGHSVTCYEKSDVPGGHWNTDYDALHLITSRDQTHFPDFPMPTSYPHFPRRSQVVDYIHSFADHFQLHDHIQYNTAVESVTPLPTDGPTGSEGWKVQLSTGEEKHFDGVLIANGHLWDAKVPAVSEKFTGMQIHTSKYQNVGDLEGERILVVGGGNSGCDMAVDVAQSRLEVDIVIRKGIHFQPKMYFGQPRSELSFLKDFTGEEQDLIFRLLAKVSIGTNDQYPGLPMPESHDLAGGATTVNDLLLYWIQHGRVGVKPGIKDINGKTVTFADGTSKDYDSIIWATGFHTSLPFLDDELIPWTNGVPVRRAAGILPQGIEQLYFVGLIAPRGPQIPIYGIQSERILRMLALHESAQRPLALARYFEQVQAPEDAVDVVRHLWQQDLEDTDRQLTALENMEFLSMPGTSANHNTAAPSSVGAHYA